MKNKIIISETSHDAFKRIVGEIKQRKDFLDTNIVLAPDRFTAFVERAVLSSMKESGEKGISTFNVEVMSFTRLASAVLGAKIKKCMTPQGSVMLITQAIADSKDQLKFYDKVVGVDGFAEELYAALTSLRNSGLSGQDIEKFAQELVDGVKAKSGTTRLQQKLVDIATIYKRYIELLKELNRDDSTTRLEELARHFEEDDSFLAGKHFYCTDIYEFSVPELEILKAIADNDASDLTIAFVGGKGNFNEDIYPDDPQNKTNVVKRVKVAAGFKREEGYDQSGKPFKDPILKEPFRTISKHLFSYVKPKNPPEVIVDGVEKVKLRSAKNRYDEILQLVVDINKKVRQEHGRYKDFEVFVPDLAGYAPELKAMFLRYDIPFFLDQKELLSEQTKVKYFLLALNVVKSDFRVDEVLDFVKNPLFAYNLDLHENEVFAFENYVIKYGFAYISKDRPFEFCHLHKDQKHYHAPHFEDANVDLKTQAFLKEEENVAPERVRQQLFKTLEPIVSGTRKLKDFVNGCRTFLDGAKSSGDDHVKKITEISTYYEKASEQVDKKLSGVLDEIDEVLGEKEKSFEDFVQTVEAMIESLKIALVPTYLDCVFVGTSGSRFMGLGDVYILGATSTDLPMQSAGGVILTPKEEDVLGDVVLTKSDGESEKDVFVFSSTTRQKNSTAMYEICDLMKKPRGKLVISYPMTLDGDSCRPSMIVDELSKMLLKDGAPLPVENIDFDRILDTPIVDSAKENEKARDELVGNLFATKKASFHEILKHTLSSNSSSSDKVLYDSAFPSLDEGDKAAIETLDKIDDKIIPTHSLSSVSVSRIETFYTCPYKHYLNYTLGLQERKKGDLLNTDNGTILHSVLEQLLKDVKAGKIDPENPPEDENLKKVVDDYFKAATADKDYLKVKPHAQRMLDKLKEECRVRVKDMLGLLVRSKFKPVMFEAKIGDKDNDHNDDSENYVGNFEIELEDGKKVEVTGYVDRIDEWDRGGEEDELGNVKPNMFLIIDYKTFKSIELTFSNVYYGQKVQLYVYMKAVEKNKDLKAAGVFYLPLYESFPKKDDEKSAIRYRYVGDVLDDDEILKAIDERSSGNSESALPPFSDKGKKSIGDPNHIKQKYNFSFLNENEFKAVADYALKIVAKGVEAINDGYVKPSPAKDACKNCQYQDYCPYIGSPERDTPRAGITSFM